MTKPIIGITANVRPNPAHEDINWSYAPTGFVEGGSKSRRPSNPLTCF